VLGRLAYHQITNIKVLIIAGLDIHQDTPVEILHTLLLGIIKYYWGQVVHYFTITLKGKNGASRFSELRARLHSLSQDGLNLPKIAVDYICDYKGALIGKHFKALAQVLPFALVDLVPLDLLRAWQVIGNLVGLAWYTHIENFGVYQVSTMPLVFTY
jgi:hypothetical protein